MKAEDLRFFENDESAASIPFGPECIAEVLFYEAGVEDWAYKVKALLRLKNGRLCYLTGHCGTGGRGWPESIGIEWVNSE